MNSDIEHIAQEMIENQSLDFNSFEDAKCVINYSTYHIEYDRITFHVYRNKSNITQEEMYLLGIAIKELLHEMPLDKEINKAREEYNILLQYALRYNEYMSANIKKTCQPDFKVYLNFSKVGIEITEFTNAESKIMTKALDDNLIKHNAIEESQHNIEKKYGKSAKEISCHYDSDRNIIVQSSIHNFTEEKRKYAEQVINKYETYKNQIPQYDEFIIMCDASGSFAFTRDSDIEDVFAALDDYLYNKVSVTVAIMTYPSNWHIRKYNNTSQVTHNDQL